MRSNNNCSISRLLDRFTCFYRRTEQGNRRQQTSLRRHYRIAPLATYFLNLSPLNAKLSSLAYVHASAQTVMRLKIDLNVQTTVYEKVTVDLRSVTDNDADR